MKERLSQLGRLAAILVLALMISGCPFRGKKAPVDSATTTQEPDKVLYERAVEDKIGRASCRERV